MRGKSSRKKPHVGFCCWIGETFLNTKKMMCDVVTQVMKKSDLAIWRSCLGALKKWFHIRDFFCIFDKRVKKKKEWWTDNLICSYP